MKSGIVLTLVSAITLIATSSYFLFCSPIPKRRKQQTDSSEIEELGSMMPNDDISASSPTNRVDRSPKPETSGLVDALVGNYVPSASLLRLWNFRLRLIFVVLSTFILGNFLAVMRRSSELEFHKGSHDREIALMWELTDLTSRIALSDDSVVSSDSDRRRLWEIEIGLGYLVHDRQVHVALDQFAECVGRPSSAKPNRECDAHEMQRRSLELSRSVEVYISQTPTYR